MKKIRILLCILMLIVLGAFTLYCFELHKRSANQPPIMEIDSELLYVSAFSDEAALCTGVSAWDPEDGDITDSVVIESISVFDSDGSRTVTYAAFDADNHVVRGTRKIIYTDYFSPTFTLSEPLNFAAWNDSTILSMIKADDMLDGDISYRISITDSELLDTYTGLYKVYFSVSNSAGDIQTVPVYLTLAKTAKSVPVIYLSEYLTYVKRDEAFDPMAYITSVESGVSGEELTVNTQSEVNSSEPGNYIVSYTVVNSLGYEGTAYLTVVVR